MSFLFRSGWAPKAQDLIPQRRRSDSANRSVSADEAMHNSVVWAALRLRADLISTSPVDCYRDLNGIGVKVNTPPVLQTPAPGVDVVEWLYSTQVDLDRFGNAFGLITARDSFGLPARIELLPAEKVTVLATGSMITGYRLGSTTYDPMQVWHEKQYTIAGLPIGLSPIANAALSLATGISAQEFAADWFGGMAVPAAHLKNTNQVLDGAQASEIKERYETSVSSGDVFVTGNDWEFAMMGAKAAESSFIEAGHASNADLCRYLGVPSDLVDVAEATGSITYASITQRNLQLLIMNLGPARTRRQRALSSLLPKPRYVKLNTDAVVLSMDPLSRAQFNAVLLSSKQRTPSEVREKDDLPPFTPAQVAEIQAFASMAPPPASTTKESSP